MRQYQSPAMARVDLVSGEVAQVDLHREAVLPLQGEDGQNNGEIELAEDRWCGLLDPFRDGRRLTGDCSVISTSQATPTHGPARTAAIGDHFRTVVFAMLLKTALRSVSGHKTLLVMARYAARV